MGLVPGTQLNLDCWAPVVSIKPDQAPHLHVWIFPLFCHLPLLFLPLRLVPHNTHQFNHSSLSMFSLTPSLLFATTAFAAVQLTAPGPGDTFYAYGNCTLAWTTDSSPASPWKNMTIGELHPDGMGTHSNGSPRLDVRLQSQHDEGSQRCQWHRRYRFVAEPFHMGLPSSEPILGNLFLSGKAQSHGADPQLIVVLIVPPSCQLQAAMNLPPGLRASRLPHRTGTAFLLPTPPSQTASQFHGDMVHWLSTKLRQLPLSPWPRVGWQA